MYFLFLLVFIPFPLVANYSTLAEVSDCNDKLDANLRVPAPSMCKRTMMTEKSEKAVKLIIIVLYSVFCNYISQTHKSHDVASGITCAKIYDFSDVHVELN